MNWLEVSLTVDGELAEAVADVLARFAPNGVTTEQGVKYLEVDGGLEEKRQRLEQSLYYLGRIRPLPPPVYQPIADQNWMEAWKKNYRPIPIGAGLVIVPAWMESPDPQRAAIRIDPGMAFGTGTHPTTQLCLELLEVAARETLPARVIDVGCGSGILSIAALKLGAGQALGVDIDPQSVKNSRENADLNGVGEELLLAQGSVAEVLEGRFAFCSAPLVLANILAPIIIRLFTGGLAQLVEPGGAIILSGILAEQEQRVLDAAAAQGLSLRDRRQMGDWVALLAGRPA